MTRSRRLARAPAPTGTARARSPAMAVERLEQIGRAGVTVSICCGPSGSSPCRWSVLALSATGEEFDQPFAANDFAHAVAIAELEITKRGWAVLP